jgi:hypothetical protein
MQAATQPLADDCALRGSLLFRNFELSSDRAREINDVLGTAHDVPEPLYASLLEELETLCPVRQFLTHNLVVLTGRSVLAGLLIGETTYTGAINYGALGSGSAAPASSDTQLGTEVKRKLYARRTHSSNQAGLDFFFSKADTSGTYNEFGLFIDGTSVANSGQLFNRALTGGWTKSSSEAMTVSITINVNAS